MYTLRGPSRWSAISAMHSAITKNVAFSHQASRATAIAGLREAR
jgi:hypothetical protein